VGCTRERQSRLHKTEKANTRHVGVPTAPRTPVYPLLLSPLPVPAWSLSFSLHHTLTLALSHSLSYSLAADAVYRLRLTARRR
jgi:hypothetical protein